MTIDPLGQRSYRCLNFSAVDVCGLSHNIKVLSLIEDTPEFDRCGGAFVSTILRPILAGLAVGMRSRENSLHETCATMSRSPRPSLGMKVSL